MPSLSIRWPRSTFALIPYLLLDRLASAANGSIQFDVLLGKPILCPLGVQGCRFAENPPRLCVRISFYLLDSTDIVLLFQASAWTTKVFIEGRFFRDTSHLLILSSASDAHWH